MSLPNFLVIGAAKAGTSSMYQYLKQHPSVYLTPMKETNFFALEGEDIHSFKYAWARPDALLRSITEIDGYRKQFNQVAGETALGEICPSYLYLPNTPRNVARYIPDTKIVAILRNPVDRAYSHYLELVRQGRERLDFKSAIMAEKQRTVEHWFWDYFYVDMGNYSRQISRYLEYFPRNQVKVYLYDDLASDTQAVVNDVLEFLGLSLISVDLSQKYRSRWLPRTQWMLSLYDGSHPVKSVFKRVLPMRWRNTMKEQYRRLISVKPPQMDPSVRRELLEIYAGEIDVLQTVVDRDLSEWLKDR